MDDIMIVSSNQVQQNVGQTIESQSLPKSNADLKQQIDTSDYQDPEEQLASNESDVQHTPADKPPQTESNSDSDQSQIAWLGSLFSKMSSDVSNTSGQCQNEFSSYHRQMNKLFRCCFDFTIFIGN